MVDGARPPACSHAVLFGRLCALCGEDLDVTAAQVASAAQRVILGNDALSAGDASPQAILHGGVNPSEARQKHRRPGLITTSSQLKISSEALQGIESSERQRRLMAQRLVLVLDLDHTLIQACPQTHGGISDTPDSVVVLPPIFGERLCLRLRPHLQAFLEEARSFCEMYLYTQGAGKYAEAVVAAIDPDRKSFGNPPRLFHRNNTPQGLKDLSEIFPADTSLVLVADDRDEVWSSDVKRNHLLKVLPYIYSDHDRRSQISLEGLVGQYQSRPSLINQEHDRSSGRKRQRCHEVLPSDMGSSDYFPPRFDGSDAAVDTTSSIKLDAQLLALLTILRRIHAAVFDKARNSKSGDETPKPSNSESTTVAKIVPTLRSRTLQGCIIHLVGVVPAGTSITSHPFAWWCAFMGASVVEELCPRTTHVVATPLDLPGCCQALKCQQNGASFCIVHPGWVLCAIATWQRPDERLFTVPSVIHQHVNWPNFFNVWQTLQGSPGVERLGRSLPPLLEPSFSPSPQTDDGDVDATELLDVLIS